MFFARGGRFVSWINAVNFYHPKNFGLSKYRDVLKFVCPRAFVCVSVSEWVSECLSLLPMFLSLGFSIIQFIPVVAYIVAPLLLLLLLSLKLKLLLPPLVLLSQTQLLSWFHFSVGTTGTARPTGLPYISFTVAAITFLSLTPSLSLSLLPSLLYSLQCQGFTHHLTLPLFFFFISFSSLVPSPCRRPGAFQRSPIFSFASVVVAESAASAAAATAACRP